MGKKAPKPNTVEELVRLGVPSHLTCVGIHSANTYGKASNAKYCSRCSRSSGFPSCLESSRAEDDFIFLM